MSRPVGTRGSRFCPRGHDKDIVGRVSYQCRECRNARKRAARRRERTVRTTCSRNHVLALTGITKAGQCKACRREWYEARKPRDGEKSLRYEQLPFPELEAWVSGHQVLRQRWPEKYQRSWWRYKDRGSAPLLWADELCTDVLGIHPTAIWGSRFFETEAA